MKILQEIILQNLGHFNQAFFVYIIISLFNQALHFLFRRSPKVLESLELRNLLIIGTKMLFFHFLMLQSILLVHLFLILLDMYWKMGNIKMRYLTIYLDSWFYVKFLVLMLACLKLYLNQAILLFLPIIS